MKIKPSGFLFVDRIGYIYPIIIKNSLCSINPLIAHGLKCDHQGPACSFTGWESGLHSAFYFFKRLK